MARLSIDVLKGSGIVFADGLRIGPARYQISVDRDEAGRTSAYGKISGEDTMLRKAYEAQVVKLRLENNEILEVRVRDSGPNEAEIEIEDHTSLSLVERLAANLD